MVENRSDNPSRTGSSQEHESLRAEMRELYEAQRSFYSSQSDPVQPKGHEAISADLSRQREFDEVNSRLQGVVQDLRKLSGEK